MIKLKKNFINTPKIFIFSKYKKILKEKKEPNKTSHNRNLGPSILKKKQKRAAGTYFSVTLSVQKAEERVLIILVEENQFPVKQPNRLHLSMS